MSCPHTAYAQGAVTQSSAVSALQAFATEEPEVPAPEMLFLSRPATARIAVMEGVDFGKMGIGLELRHLKRLWEMIFPGKPFDAQTAEQALRAARERGVYPETDDGKYSPTYLEDAFKKLAADNGSGALVFEIYWNRDVDDTELAVKNTKAALLDISNRADRAGVPLYLAGHSWGTVLLYTALMDLQDEGRTVRVEKLITMGSPLMPERAWLKAFVWFEAARARIRKALVKPAGVKRWVNYYADRDIISSSLERADSNVRTDSKADEYEALLKQQGTPQSRKELSKLRSAALWHRAYYTDFTLELGSIGQTPSWHLLQDNSRELLPPF
ncbi:MAG: hypothetical protein GX410_03380 [Elusimicrobia bacterium]|nr:hypothetical protein [Elusimicrobiota bacterium]